MNQIFIADSFLVRHSPTNRELAYAVAYERHLERFEDSVKRVFYDAGSKISVAHESRLQDFLGSVTSAIKQPHEQHDPLRQQKLSFPRLEAWVDLAGGSFRLNLLQRNAPELKNELIIKGFTAQKFANAWAKGPNIAKHQELNAAATGEVLITDAAGTVLETTTAALVWIENEILHTVKIRDNRVSSVTEQLVLEIAAELGVETKPKNITLNELQGVEAVWGVNALHGIRPAKILLQQPPNEPALMESLEHALEPSVKSEFAASVDQAAKPALKSAEQSDPNHKDLLKNFQEKYVSLLQAI